LIGVQLQLERRVRMSRLRGHTEATGSKHDHAGKSDSPAAVGALPKEWAAKGRHDSLSCGTLRCGKRLASYRRVDGIEDRQTGDIRHPTHGDRIPQILNFALRVGERRPLGKVRAVRIA
jgi:hypothetical protein